MEGIDKNNRSYIKWKNEIIFDEWKECRSAIAKYGEYVYGIRKYGFTVITGLLTANAYLFIKLQGFEPIERLLLSSGLGLLILGLFITDMYYLVLIRASVLRAIDIETSPPYKNVIKLTTTIHKQAKQTYIDKLSILVYIAFVFISVSPSLFIEKYSYSLIILFLSIAIGLIILFYANIILETDREIKNVIIKNKEDRMSQKSHSAPGSPAASGPRPRKTRMR